MPQDYAPPNWSMQRVIVTGGAGFLGSAIVRGLHARGLKPHQVHVVRSATCDLTVQAQADRLMREAFGESGGPTLVLHAAGAVGGLQANKDEPGRFFFANMAMAMNLIDACRTSGFIERGGAIVQVGSMTSYPAHAAIPFQEEDLWNGYPDAASAPYAVAKLAAWQMLDAYHRQYGLRAGYVIPVNLYGPGDNIDNVRSAHVAGTLIKRFVDAQKTGQSQVINWGTGTPTRQFLFIDDAAEGVIRAGERALMGSGQPTPINLGSGQEISIRALAELIARLVGYSGVIAWDAAKPDGQPRRCLSVQRARDLLGFEARIDLDEGLARTIDWYRSRSG